MKRLICFFMSSLLGLTLSTTTILGIAQPAPVAVIYNQAQLDQLLAPIALYPDELLSHVLGAAIYPQDVDQAARFVQANPNLIGDQLAEAVEWQPWNPDVQYLTQFPEILAMMESEMVWTEQLGDAFLAQQTAVMNTVQRLRHRAKTHGTLRKIHQQVAIENDGIIVIESITPNQIYVPYYNPTVVYGAWGQPDYPPPFVWEPPVQYQQSYLTTGFAFGAGIIIANSLLYPTYPDWHRRELRHGDWRGHNHWRAATPWRVDRQRRANALAFRSVSAPNRYRSAPEFLPNNNFNRNGQPGQVNNWAPARAPNARLPRADTSVRSFNNRANEVNRAQSLRRPNTTAPQQNAPAQPSLNQFRERQSGAQPNAGFSRQGVQVQPQVNNNRVESHSPLRQFKRDQSRPGISPEVGPNRRAANNVRQQNAAQFRQPEARQPRAQPAPRMSNEAARVRGPNQSSMRELRGQPRAQPQNAPAQADRRFLKRFESR